MRPTSIAAALLLAVTSASATAQTNQSAMRPAADHAPRDEASIAGALSAAPASIARIATVVDHSSHVLRKGSSDWVCLPDMPDVPNESPMCLDTPWRELIDAWMHKRTPSVTRVGFGYMLQGDMPVSNVDPFATAPSSSNQWLQNSGPHVMIVFPDPRVLDGLSTDPANGGPYVMWKGTPYAHLMVPATAAPK
jgi:hypothetical protein